jgi:hypothetical protein
MKELRDRRQADMLKAAEILAFETPQPFATDERSGRRYPSLEKVKK